MAQRLDVRYVRYYTDGSAAPKLAPLQPFKTIKLPKIKSQKRRTIHVDPIATAGILMAAVMLVLLIVGAVELSAARKDAVQMQQYVQSLREENEELTSRYKATYTLEDVQKTADALGLVPKEQVTRITMQMPQEQTPEAPGVLSRVYTFLVGLFA